MSVGHAHLESASGRASGRLAVVLGLTASFAAIELVVGILTGSLAIQADAAHMVVDVVALSMALAAAWVARRPPSRRATYGYYRFEVLAALANAVLLVFVAGYIGYEAWQRFAEPPEVAGLPMLVVALVGLLVNGVGITILSRAPGHATSLNLRGAIAELTADAAASLAVLAAAVVTLATGWPYADPVFAAAIGILIVPRTWSLLRAALAVLLEATPGHLDLAELERALLAVPGVRRVHDIHVWTITSGFVAMSGHAEIESDRPADAVLADMRAVLHERFGIDHCTIQVESSPAGEACAAERCAPA